jgi:hypothetical protein
VLKVTTLFCGRKDPETANHRQSLGLSDRASSLFIDQQRRAECLRQDNRLSLPVMEC